MYKIIDICILVILIKERKLKFWILLIEWYMFRLHFIPWTVPQRGDALSTVLGTSKYDIGVRADSRNPLYLSGYFRKNFKYADKKISFCGLKGIFFCQIHVIIQMVIYVIFMFIERFLKSENLDSFYIYMYVWSAISMCIFICVKEYYIKILNKTFMKKEFDKRNICPFSYINYGSGFKTKPEEYKLSDMIDLKQWVKGSCDNAERIFSYHWSKDYKRDKKIGFESLDEIWVYCEEVKGKEDINIKIFVQAQRIEKKHLDALNDLYQSVIKKHLFGIYKTYDWYLNFILYVEQESKEFHDILRNSVFQQEGFYRLPVGIIKEKLYIAKQEDLYALDKYEKMKMLLLKI